MSNSATFSYAQAIKGHSATQSAMSQSTATSQTPSATGSQSREPNTTTSTSTRAPSVAVSTTSNDVDPPRSIRSASAKPETSGSNASEADSKSDQGAASVPIADSSNSPLRAAEQAQPDTAAKNSGDARGRTANIGSDATDSNENKKGRKPKRGKNSEKDAESSKEHDGSPVPAPKVELTEARIPEVNIWVQRQAQAAKTKPAVDATAPTASAVGSTVTRQANTDPKQRLASSQPAESSAFSTTNKAFKKDGEQLRSGGTQGPRRTGPRGSRVPEKEPENVNLLASNSTSWPTPETAAVNSKPAPPTQADKEDQDSTSAKPKKRSGWTTMDLDHSAYQPPFTGRAPRGGRAGGGRNGRDAAGNTHAVANVSEKSQEANSGARSNSGPRRAPAEGSGHREGRRGAPQSEQSRAPKESAPDNASAEQSKSNGVVNGTAPLQTAPRSSSSHRRTDDNGAKNSESHKDARVQGNRDNHHAGQNGSNHRGERTRGGGRGRGGFSNHNNANGIPHHGQQQYMPTNGYYPANGSRQMASYIAGYQPLPYPSPYPSQAGHGPRRPVSVSHPRGSGSSRTTNGRMPNLPPMVMPYDPIYHPANGGVYPMEQAFMQPEYYQNIQRQLEFYFSENNLKKDYHLRRHMDSQGFVDMNVLATFPRLSAMTNGDLNIVINACMSLPGLDTIIGEDGIVRVRNKEDWQKWVLESASRDSSACHDGPHNPQPLQPIMAPMVSPSYPVEQPQMFSPSQEHGFAPYTNSYGLAPPVLPTMNGVNGLNGVNGHPLPHESQLSATVPEFSPGNVSGFSTGNDTNGAHASMKNTVNKNATSTQEESTATSNDVEHLSNGVSPSHETNGQ